MFDSVNERRRDLRESQLRSILPRLFGELSDETFAEFLPHLNWKLLAGSETLFLQGDEGDGLYILVSGRLQVLLNEANGSPRQEWTKRCLRQADGIYLIGHADDQPNLSGLERELLQADTILTSANRNLVLLHDSDSVGGFSGASRWLQERRIRTCHHARLDRGRRHGLGCRLAF